MDYKLQKIRRYFDIVKNCRWTNSEKAENIVFCNCDYKTVSVLLGHSNISTTLNLYVHPNMEQKKRCVEQMFKALR